MLQLPHALVDIILDYLPDRELLPWIDESKLDWRALSANPAAMYLLEANPEKIIREQLFYNPVAAGIMIKYPNLFSQCFTLLNGEAIQFIREFDSWWWSNLSSNPNAIALLEANPDKIDWIKLSINPAAIHLLEANPSKIDWFNASYNAGAIALLEANPNKIIWPLASFNPSAIALLEANPDKIDWECLSSNPAAIHMLKQNMDKIDWENLMYNPAALLIIEENPDKIFWSVLSMNVGITTLTPKPDIRLLL